MDENTAAEIGGIIGYTFSDTALLARCFVHSSYAHEHKDALSNERLEFLGDAVLELVFSEKLYHEGGDEGVMTVNRQKLVSDDMLEKIVKKMGLDRFLLYGGGKSNLGKKAIPSLFEAVVAGIYLDGGYENAKRFVLSHAGEEEGEFNYIGALQEYLQGRGEALPVYTCTDKRGGDNSPVFTFTASAGGLSASGEGESKKTARMSAAKQLYRRLTAEKK